MRKFSSYLVAGLIGGIAAGCIMWIATRRADQTHYSQTPINALPWDEATPRETPAEADRAAAAKGAAAREGSAASNQSGIPGQGSTAGQPVTPSQQTARASTSSPAASASSGELEGTPPPARIDISKLPMEATLVDQVLVPVPSEIFTVLDKIGKPVWKDVMRPLSEDRKLSSREQIALLLGTVIADGFIAVEAEDSAELKVIGQNVLKLSDALGVRQAVVKRSSAILEASDKKDWPRVRKELDGALTDVRTAMIELESEALAQLVSLGGWLRGTEALAAVVVQDYTQDAAELLHQPALIDHFDRRIATMPERTRGDDLVSKMRAGLTEIRPLMGTGTAIPESSVQSISGIAERLVKVIGVRGK